jgi:hypothetical protein
MVKKSLMGSSASLPDAMSWTEREDKPINLGTNVVEREIPWKPSGPSSTGDSTLCIDCGFQTQPKKAEGNYEQFIVCNEVWQAAGMPPGRVDPKSFVLKGGGGCLCVGCIEQRLGRKLTNADFAPLSQPELWRHRDSGWLTPRLVDRLQTGMTDPRPIPEPLMNAIREARGMPRLQRKMMQRAKSGEINGDEVYILLRKPGREPTAIHFKIGPEGKKTIDLYYSDFTKFLEMAREGNAGFDLSGVPEDEDEEVDPLEHFKGEL